jgi:hypothetical protein
MRSLDLERGTAYAGAAVLAASVLDVLLGGGDMGVVHAVGASVGLALIGISACSERF